MNFRGTLLVLAVLLVSVVGAIWLFFTMELYVIAVVLLLSAPLILAAVALISDRWTQSQSEEPDEVRGRLRAGLCVYCGYDLHRCASRRCPECGRRIERA